MYKSEAVIAVLSAILWCGCSHDNGVVPPQDADSNLEQSLVGRWAISEFDRIKFNADKTYTDSTWELSVTVPGARYLAFVSTGRYSVSNSVLYFEDMHYTIFLDSGLTNPGYFNPGRAREIELQGNRLVCQPVDILIPSGTFSPDVDGVWSVTTEMSWGNYTGLVYAGRLLRRYTFLAGSDSCTIETQYLDGHPVPDARAVQEYLYSSPLLTLPVSMSPNIRVDFKNESMYWYYIFDAYSMTRL